jgi:LysM repeat protein
MAAHSRARYLAPIALAAVIAGAYVIVHSGLNAKPSTAHHAVSRPSAAFRRYARFKSYVVQPGDNLTSIASKTGIALATLLALNPTVDPNALQTGQHLVLRR